MQKKLIALAVASLVSAPVFAQSTVSIYGIVDQALTSSNGSKGSVTSLNSSGYTTERLGFKGSEDMGNGMKANFMLEMGETSQNGYFDSSATGQLFQRTSTLGLSGNWGQVNFGRQYTPVFSIQAANDIFRVAGVGSIYAFTNDNVTRASNSIRFDSASMNGFSAAVMYGLGDTTTSASAYPSAGAGAVSPVDPKDLGRHVGLNVKYANGPLAIGYGYGEQKQFTVPGAGFGVDKQKTNALFGSYDFKVVAVNLGYQTNKTDVATAGVVARDNSVWNIGATIPVFGQDSIKVVYANFNEKRAGLSGNDAKLISLGYVHPMSKRTVLYGTYAKLTNDNGAALSLFGGAQATSTVGYDPSAFQLGLQHAF